MNVEPSFKYEPIGLKENSVDSDQDRQAAQTTVSKNEEYDSCFGSLFSQIGKLFNSDSIVATELEASALIPQEMTFNKRDSSENSVEIDLRMELEKAQNVNRLLNNRNNSLRRQYEKKSIEEAASREELKSYYQFYAFIQKYYPAAVDLYTEQERLINFRG